MRRWGGGISHPASPLIGGCPGPPLTGASPRQAAGFHSPRSKRGEIRLHPRCLVCGLHLLAALQTPVPPALLLCTVWFPARTAPARQALPLPPPPPSPLPPGHFSMQPCFPACPFPKELLNHIPVARGLCFCCKRSGSISSPSDLPFGAECNHPVLHRQVGSVAPSS